MRNIRVFYPEGRFLEADWTRGEGERPARFVQVLRLFLEATGTEAAELAYAICNSYPGELHCPSQYADVVAQWREREQRSMSVGDVVVVDGTYWLCAPMGFRELDDAEIAGIDFRV